MSDKVTRGSAWTMQAELGAPTPTAVWGCRSRFCRRRGPFWVRSHKDAKADAAKHRARRFLGLWGHDAVVRQGQTFIQFLREMRFAPAR